LLRHLEEHRRQAAAARVIHLVLKSSRPDVIGEVSTAPSRGMMIAEIWG
jgi:hypothetical protein